MASHIALATSSEARDNHPGWGYGDEEGADVAAQASGTLACPHCGRARPDGALFCMHCGRSLDPADPPGTTAPAPPAGPPLAPPVIASLFPVETALPTPSAVGRPGSRLGWAGAFTGVGLFLAATIAVLVAAGNPDAATPAAHWDPTLQKPSAVSAGQAFDLAVEAANPSAAATDRLWLIVDWRPPGVGSTGSVGTRLLACVPADCEFRHDPAAGVTVVVWSGLPAGSHRVLRATLAVDGLSAGQTLTYRVTAGTGAVESRLREPMRWTVAAIVQ